jgi:hypothetical protein
MKQKPVLTGLPQDFGGVTILWSQPISALQIKTSEGEWRWVRHMENALVRATFNVANA